MLTDSCSLFRERSRRRFGLRSPLPFIYAGYKLKFRTAPRRRQVSPAQLTLETTQHCAWPNDYDSMVPLMPRQHIPRGPATPRAWRVQIRTGECPHLRHSKRGISYPHFFRHARMLWGLHHDMDMRSCGHGSHRLGAAACRAPTDPTLTNMRVAPQIIGQRSSCAARCSRGCAGSTARGF